MNTDQIIITTNIVLVNIAKIHKLAHKAKLQTSHIYNLAGLTLNHRNATNAHTILIHNVDSKNNH